MLENLPPSRNPTAARLAAAIPSLPRRCLPPLLTALGSMPTMPAPRRLLLILTALGLITMALTTAACTPELGASSEGWGAVAPGHDNAVYLTTIDGQLLALDDFGIEGGVSQRARSTIGGEPGFHGTYNPPAIGLQHIYVAGIDGYLYALERPDNAGTVGIAWRNAPITTDEIQPLVGSPALDAAERIVAVGSADGNLYAYHAVTGEPLDWSPFPAGAEIWSTPVINDGIAYFGTQGGTIYALDLNTGAIKWQYETGGAVVAKPLIHKSMLIVGSFDRQLYALDLRSGSLRWQFQAGNWWWASPVSAGRTIFAPAMDGKVYALDENGRELWQHDLGDPIVSDPVLVERGLAVATVDGRLALLRATETAYGPAQAFATLRIGSAEIKAPLTTPRTPAAGGSGLPDAVYVGSDDGTVRKMRASSGLGIEWCYDAENNRGGPGDCPAR